MRHSGLSFSLSLFLSISISLSSILIYPHLLGDLGRADLVPQLLEARDAFKHLSRMLRLGFAEICGVLVVGWEIPNGDSVSAGVSGLGDDAGVGYVAIADESLWAVGPRQG